MSQYSGYCASHVLLTLHILGTGSWQVPYFINLCLCSQHRQILGPKILHGLLAAGTDIWLCKLTRTVLGVDAVPLAVRFSDIRLFGLFERNSSSCCYH